MVNFSKDSHYTYTYGRELFDIRKESSDRIKITLGKPVYGKSLLAESIVAAQQIYEENGDVSVCLSGGIDSIATLQAFVEAKVPFSVYTMRMTRGLNSLDIEYAIKVCEAYGIKQNMIDIDIVDFFDNGGNSFWAETLENANPHYNLFFHFIDKIPGCPINGGQIPVVIGNQDNARSMFFGKDNIDYAVFHEDNTTTHPHLTGYKRVSEVPDKLLPYFPICADTQDFSLMRYLKYRNRPGIPQFFFYSPGQIGAALSMPQYDLLAKGEMLWNYNTKLDIYRAAGFNYPANSIKRTGAEQIYSYYIENRKQFSVLFRYPYRWRFTGSHARNIYSYEKYLSEGLC